MQKTLKYTIFKTKWGYFGLAGTADGLLRTHLPWPQRGMVRSQLLINLPAGQYDGTFLESVQQRIADYFEGDCVNFDDVGVVLDGFSWFGHSVLTACRDIAFGQTISYGRLAKRLARGSAGRAVGAVLAKNPLPLIIPCHRVVCSNGKIGGFSALRSASLRTSATVGGVDLKAKLLAHERKYSLVNWLNG
jgi:methylated-DNA-[protein]-cysteine S-methyltransferase